MLSFSLAAEYRAADREKKGQRAGKLPHEQFVMRHARELASLAAKSIKWCEPAQSHRTLSPTVTEYPQPAPSFIVQSSGLAQASDAWCDAGRVPSFICMACSRLPGWTPPTSPRLVPNHRSILTTFAPDCRPVDVCKIMAAPNIIPAAYVESRSSPALTKGRTQLGVLRDRCIIR